MKFISKQNFKRLVWLVVVLVVVVTIYSVTKPLPKGVSVTGPERLVSEQSVRFLADKTYLDAAGERQIEQEIFDEVMAMIKGAERYVLIDMFLFNSFQGKEVEDTRALASELTAALVEQKKRYPDMAVYVVTDPLNMVYGGYQSPEIEALTKAGIPVVLTDLTKLRDSNPLYSGFWRLVIRPIGNILPDNILPHPFDQRLGKISFHSYLALFNFKANHRKLVVVDYKEAGQVKMRSLVTSANPHDGSSAHGNVALVVDDFVWQDFVASEQAVANFSDREILEPGFSVVDRLGDVSVWLISEREIKKSLLKIMDQTKKGDEIMMSMFYFSDRGIIKAFKRASDRGVMVKIILDPNKDAFGREKNGIPNRQVADELVQSGLSPADIRWCDTNGEQCHAKLVLVKTGERYYLTAGSANLTRRNIGDYNLETNLLVSAGYEFSAWKSAGSYFAELWNNESGRIYTADYAKYAETSRIKWSVYYLMERLGTSTF